MLGNKKGMSKVSILILFVFSWPAFMNEYICGAYTPEIQILLQAKAALQDPTNALKSWDESSASPCEWQGIACNGVGEVTEISLVYKSLSGKISSDVCNLRSLRRIELGYNHLRGKLPSGFVNCSQLEVLNVTENLMTGSLPDLSRLIALKRLDLSVNNFGGQFPVWVGNLTNLVSLNLEDNYFLPGMIPHELMRLERLEFLYLSNSNFHGSIPPFLGNLTKLGLLEFSRNRLTGEIPGEIGRLKRLYQLEMYDNNLTGEIPKALGNLTELRDFDASRNMLSGSIPEEFENLENLVSLQLYSNMLSGQIPEGLGNLRKLSGLSLYQNMLTGPLPPTLGYLSNFSMIDVSQNMLSGTLPQKICKAGTLLYFLVLENMFTGEVPESYASCQRLVRFRVNSNNLSGRIPDGVWGLPHVSILDLSSNHFEGAIPPAIGNAKNLSELYIQNNNFTGSLPAEIGQARGLAKIDVSRNRLSGRIPSDVGNLRTLNSLHLQENMFAGPIPHSLGQCTLLADINLARNKLSGSIPGSLGSMQVLNSLNLSHNELTGEIPGSLSSLKLSSIDFSNNLLTGTVPIVLMNEAGHGSFSGNPGLCGAGMDSALSPCRSDGRANLNVARWITGCMAGAVMLVFFVGFILMRAGRRRLHRNRNKANRSFWDMKSFHKLSFNEEEVLDSMNEEHVIGHGGSGRVYRIELSNGESVAVKKLWACKSGHGSKCPRDKELKAEVETLGTIRHKNIVKLYCCFSNGDFNLLVYEYMPNGNLWESLHGTRSRRTPDWPTRYKIALGVAHGLAYLHHDCVPPIIHRDVKSTNILLDSDYQARVADFGFAKILQGCARGDSTTAIAGTHGYIAPEYAYSSKVNEKSDVYSYGVVLLELVTGKRPVEAEFGDNKDIVWWITSKVVTREGAFEVLDDRICDSFRDQMIRVLKIAVRCTTKLPTLRPSMKEVVQMLVEANPGSIANNKMGADHEKVSKEAAVVDIPAKLKP